MQLNRYLEDIWKVLTIANKAIGDYEPWAKMKEGKEDEAMALVALITNIMARVSLLLDSVMPDKIGKIAASLGITIDNATSFTPFTQNTTRSVFINFFNCGIISSSLFPTTPNRSGISRWLRRSYWFFDTKCVSLI